MFTCQVLWEPAREVCVCGCGRCRAVVEGGGVEVVVEGGVGGRVCEVGMCVWRESGGKWRVVLTELCTVVWW